MTATLDRVCCASLAPPDLAVLADLRAAADVRVTVVQGRAWIRWGAGHEEVLRRVLPLRGVELFARIGDHWYRPGHHLPSFAVPLPPEDEGMPLSSAVVPAAVDATPPGGADLRPAPLCLARDDVPHPVSALRCALAELARWAERASTARLSALRASLAEGRVFVHGGRPPELPAAERFWGDGVYLPAGFRTDPELSSAAIRQVLRAEASDVLVLAHDGFEAIPAEAFRPLSRAGVRLALGGSPK